MTTTKPVPGSETQIALGRAFLRERSRAGVTLDRIAKALRTSINTVRWHEAGARSLRADDLIIAADEIGCATVALLVDENGKPITETDHDNPA